MNPYPTCKACRWWLSPPKPFTIGQCSNPKLYSNDSDGAASDLGPNTISTGPEFGCIHFAGMDNEHRP